MRVLARLVPPLCLAAAASLVHGSTAAGQCSTAVQKLTAEQKYDDARAAVQALLKQNEKDDAAMHCMARVFMAQGKSGDAVDWLEKAIKINDKNALHHLQLGNALGSEAQKASKLRQPFLAKRVKTEFEKTVQLDPSLPDGHEGLMQFYLQAPGFMGGSLEKAKEQAKIIGTLNALDGHRAEAEIARHEKDVAGEEKALLAVLAAAPDTASGWYQLDLFYQNQKNWPQAFALMDRMLKERPSEPLAHYYYARAAALSGENLERGERELKQWFATSSKDASQLTLSTMHWRLGMIYEKEGKKEDARSEYKEAVTLNPKSDAKKMLDALR